MKKIDQIVRKIDILRENDCEEHEYQCISASELLCFARQANARISRNDGVLEFKYKGIWFTFRPYEFGSVI